MADSEGSLQLIKATLNNDQQQVATLLALGVDVTVKDEHDNTALHYALLHGYRAISKLLLADKNKLHDF